MGVWGWEFLCLSKVPPNVSRVEFGINTETPNPSSPFIRHAPVPVVYNVTDKGMQYSAQQAVAVCVDVCVCVHVCVCAYVRVCVGRELVTVVSHKLELYISVVISHSTLQQECEMWNKHRHEHWIGEESLMSTHLHSLYILQDTSSSIHVCEMNAEMSVQHLSN